MQTLDLRQASDFARVILVFDSERGREEKNFRKIITAANFYNGVNKFKLFWAEF